MFKPTLFAAFQPSPKCSMEAKFWATKKPAEVVAGLIAFIVSEKSFNSPPLIHATSHQ